MQSTRKPKRPVSPAALAANRANAALSTGPRTPEGKAVSAQNSRRHGFAASSFGVVRLEDLQEVAHLKADLVSVYQPVNSQELFALERMAVAQQTIRRAARLEAGLFTNCLNESLNIASDEPFLPMNPDLCGDGDIEVTRAQNRNFLLAEGFHRLTRQSNSWSLFLRYQAQAERLYRRALDEFDRLKGLRNELPNEPISDPEAEGNTDPYVQSPTNPSATPEAAPAPATPAAPGPSAALHCRAIRPSPRRPRRTGPQACAASQHPVSRTIPTPLGTRPNHLCYPEISTCASACQRKSRASYLSAEGGRPGRQLLHAGSGQVTGRG